jgi:uncharacterized protein DUF3311
VEFIVSLLASRVMSVSHLDRKSASTGSRWWLLLLVLPFLGLLWVPFYNRIEPSLFGIPFFYWYQFLWVPLTSLIIGLVHVMTRDAMAGVDRGNHGEQSPHAGRRP